MTLTDNRAQQALTMLIEYLAADADAAVHCKIADDKHLLDTTAQLIEAIEHQLAQQQPIFTGDQNDNSEVVPASEDHHPDSGDVALQKESEKNTPEQVIEAPAPMLTTSETPLLPALPPEFTYPLHPPAPETETKPALRLGAVPQRTHTMPPIPLPPPLVKITIANARIGEHFAAPIKIRAENGEPVSITAVFFNHDRAGI
ncbi:MAG: hypothetical protein XXXJIFNMEKO3_01930 [Candidatus Erwinia impunctatus]|nr:hypothetical protein XXXJIFNMEKO_01930 [Culicoides impunctatus]